MSGSIAISLVGLRVLTDREGIVEDQSNGLYVIGYDDGTGESRGRDTFTVLDMDDYRARIATAARGSAVRDMTLPAWGKHQRMGFTVLYGLLEPAGHGTARLTVPAVEGDELYADLPEEVHIVPMEGPAFFGFQRLTEETVMSHRRMARRMKPRAYEPPPEPHAGVPDPAEGQVVTRLVTNGAEESGRWRVIEADDDHAVLEPVDGDGKAFPLTIDEWRRDVVALEDIEEDAQESEDYTPIGRAPEYTNDLPAPRVGLVLSDFDLNGAGKSGRWPVADVTDTGVVLDVPDGGGSTVTLPREKWNVATIFEIRNADDLIVYEMIPF
jgi:hypothetical protein